jgi:hypothetical protein
LSTLSLRVVEVVTLVVAVPVDFVQELDLR